MDCSWCGLGLPTNMEGVVIDHIIPVARGGPNDRWNKQLLHTLCNTRKRDKMTPQAYALAIEHAVKLHEPNGQLRQQRRQRRPYTTRPEVRELKRLAALPPSLAELQDAIDDVLRKPGNPYMCRCGHGKRMHASGTTPQHRHGECARCGCGAFRRQRWQT